MEKQKFVITHNEGKKEIHMHSPNCPRTKGQSVWLYSYIGSIYGDTWEEVVEQTSKGFDAIGEYVYVVPDKCMMNILPDAVKTKYFFKDNK